MTLPCCRQARFTRVPQSYGENDTLPEKLVVEFPRGHVYWRRNFRPEIRRLFRSARLRNQETLELEASTLDGACDHVVILRHALMSPYLIDGHNGVS